MGKGLAKCNHCAAVSYDPERRDTDTVRTAPKTYKVPDRENITGLPDEIVDWFRDERGIEQRTLVHFEIGKSTQWFPQLSGEAGCVAFPYFDGKDLINCKYRTKNKDFRMTAQAKLILYGLNNIQDSDIAVIVEGEIDALSVWQAGMPTVVSVPNGVSGMSESEKQHFKETGKFDSDRPINLEYIDNSYDKISHIKKWVIWTDTDLPGLKLRDELIRRFGQDNCAVVNSGDFKDANEVLKHKGSEQVLKFIMEAKEVQIEGVVDVDTRKDYIKNLMEFGIEKGLETPMKAFNKHYRPKLGELDVIVGVANHGKSYYALWYAVWTAMEYNWKWALYMPENTPASRIDKTLIEILVGDSFDNMKVSQIDLAIEWIHKYFVVIDYQDKVVSMDDVLLTCKSAVKRYGVNGFIVDPLNDLYHDYMKMSVDQYYQGMLSNVRRFKKATNSKFLLTVHPHTGATREKEHHNEQGERPRVIELPDATGGNIFHNRTDNGISVYRNVWSDNPEYYLTSEIHVQKIKFQDEVGRPTPRHKPIKLKFDPVRRRYRDEDGVDPLEGKFENDIYNPKTLSEQGEIDWMKGDSFKNRKRDDLPF
jgi:twinkle protein